MRTALFAILASFMLAGCQHQLTLEEAQEQCMKKGGLLMVIYTQQITAAGPGEQVASPGSCISPNKFGAPPTNNPPAK